MDGLAPTRFIDRRGRPMALRGLTGDDAPAIIALDQAIARAGEGMVVDADELTSDPATVAERIDGSLSLGVFSADQLVAEAHVCRHAPRRLRHVGVLAIGVHPAWQGAGLGRRLMDALVLLCDRRGVLRIELYVRADNQRARALYASMGFVVEAVRRGFVREDDRFVDDLVMVRAASGHSTR